MNPALLTAVAWPVAAVAVFALTTVWLNRRSRGVCWKVFALSLGPAFLGTAYSLYYLHFLPEPAWFYEWRSFTGSEALVLAPAVVGAACSKLLPGWCRAVILGGIVFPAFLPFAKPVWMPLDLDSLKNQWVGGVARQSTRSTCGPASAATILRELGLVAQESELALEARSTGSGTEAWYLARAMRRRGVKVDFLTEVKLPSEAPWPCIAGVKLLGGTGHFIPILRNGGNRYWVGDPLGAGQWLEESELRRRYEFTGFCMAVRLP